MDERLPNSRCALVSFSQNSCAGIAPSGRHLIRTIIASLRDDGVSVLLTSHDLDEVEKLADHVVIVNALAARDASAAEEAMLQHIHNVHPSTLEAMGATE